MKKNSYLRSYFLRMKFLRRNMKLSLRFNHLIILGLIAIASITWMVSCQHATENLSTYPKVCFDTKILFIFQNSCAMSGCHTTGSSEVRYDFSYYEGIMDAVVPFSPSKSPAYQAITAIWGESAMPPSQPISEENRTLIRLWIEQGAEKDPSCSTTTGGGGVDSAYYNARACFQRDIYPIILTNCNMSPCHDGKSSYDGEILFGLNDYTSIRGLTVPKYPNSSSLYHVITGGGDNAMPPAPYNPLKIAEIDSIYNWILYGALNENCGNKCDTAVAATYSGIVSPIINKYCYGCHHGANAAKGFHLETYDDVKAAALNGKLVGSLKGQSPYKLMPQGSSLSSCSIYLIEKWIREGALQN
jgi:hypothetical protein